MWKHIQYLQFKHIWRSQRLGTGIAGRIFMIFFILYFGAIFLSMGLFYSEIMEESDVEENPIFLLHRYILYYLLADIVMRVIFQEVSEVKFRQMALLPIPKHKIITYILGGSVFSLFNLLPLVFIIPVAIRTLMPIYVELAAILWIIAIFLFLVFNNYLALQLKHFVSDKPYLYFVFAAIAGLIYFADSSGWVPLSSGFHAAMEDLLTSYWPVLILPIIVYSIFILVYKRMLGQAYISGNLKKSNFLERLDFSSLGERGFDGIVFQKNMQLIMRNKRLRTQMIFSMLFVLYGLFLYSNDRYGPTFLLFWGLYMTGIVVLSFAQYIWSYQGAYFELLVSLPMRIKDYVRAQYNFLILGCLLTGIPSMLYYFMNPDIPFINLAALLFNVGVNVPALLAASMYNKRKLETNTAGTFNMQGISGLQFVFIFAVLLIPIFIYLPFSLTGYPTLGLYVVGGIGLMGLLARPLWINGIVALFHEKKYGLTEGYRSN